MGDFLEKIKLDLENVVNEWEASGQLSSGDIFVIGCSTSEVCGERIGSAGSEEIARIIFDQMVSLQKRTGIQLAFQCCEHLNRAIIIERGTMLRSRLDEVSVVPVKKAGGSMAAYAYREMNDPVVVEYIKAQAGMDIGETMIGMHLQHVAVPIRFNQRYVGEARLTAAYTRPKLIGGVRANYENTRLN